MDSWESYHPPPCWNGHRDSQLLKSLQKRCLQIPSTAGAIDKGGERKPVPSRQTSLTCPGSHFPPHMALSVPRSAFQFITSHQPLNEIIITWDSRLTSGCWCNPRNTRIQQHTAPTEGHSWYKLSHLPCLLSELGYDFAFFSSQPTPSDSSSMSSSSLHLLLPFSLPEPPTTSLHFPHHLVNRPFS